jgi:hypothetical protein
VGADSRHLEDWRDRLCVFRQKSTRSREKENWNAAILNYVDSITSVNEVSVFRNDQTLQGRDIHESYRSLISIDSDGVRNFRWGAGG